MSKPISASDWLLIKLLALNSLLLLLVLLLPQAPWGGNKNSGFGRELGEWGLENFLSVKQVTTYVSPDPWGWYSPPSKL
jgi:hypothetical protein